MGAWLLLALLCCVRSQPFGHDMRKHFLMRETNVNLNNGAFGTGSRYAYEQLQKYNMEMESNCNYWFRGGYQPKLELARKRLAQYVNVHEDDLVIVENASSGANAVLRSLADNLPLQKGDKVLFLSVVYPMVRNVMAYITKEKQLTQIEVNITFPLSSPHQVLQALSATLDTFAPGEIKIASLDHISSYPAALLPIKEMVALCKAKGIFVLVDGAHVLGQIPVDITDIGADAYISNAHKWLYAPKSASILHVTKKWQHLIFPNILSSEAGTSDFVDLFRYIGTVNYNSFLTTIDSLNFRLSLPGGEKGIVDYMHDLAWNGGLKVAQIWKTGLLVTDEAMVPAMSLVIFPTKDSGVVNRIRFTLETRYDTWIQPGSVVTTDGQVIWYVRLSAQIYLEESDFVLFAERVLEIMNQREPPTL